MDENWAAVAANGATEIESNDKNLLGKPVGIGSEMYESCDHSIDGGSDADFL